MSADKRRRLEKRLDAHREEIDALETRIINAVDPVEKVRLQRQLAALEAEVADLEAQIAALDETPSPAKMASSQRSKPAPSPATHTTSSENRVVIIVAIIGAIGTITAAAIGILPDLLDGDDDNGAAPSDTPPAVVIDDTETPTATATIATPTLTLTSTPTPTATDAAATPTPTRTRTPSPEPATDTTEPPSATPDPPTATATPTASATPHTPTATATPTVDELSFREDFDDNSAGWQLTAGASISDGSLVLRDAVIQVPGVVLDGDFSAEITFYVPQLPADFGLIVGDLDANRAHYLVASAVNLLDFRPEISDRTNNDFRILGQGNVFQYDIDVVEPGPVTLRVEAAGDSYTLELSQGQEANTRDVTVTFSRRGDYLYIVSEGQFQIRIDSVTVTP